MAHTFAQNDASLGPEILTAARTIAVQQGSLPMVQLLAPKDEKHAPANLVLVAVEGRDADIVKWTLSKSNPDDVAKFVKAMLDTSSDQIFSLWEEHLVTIPRYGMREQVQGPGGPTKYGDETARLCSGAAQVYLIRNRQLLTRGPKGPPLPSQGSESYHHCTFTTFSDQNSPSAYLYAKCQNGHTQGRFLHRNSEFLCPPVDMAVIK